MEKRRPPTELELLRLFKIKASLPGNSPLTEEQNARLEALLKEEKLKLEKQGNNIPPKRVPLEPGEKNAYKEAKDGKLETFVDPASKRKQIKTKNWWEDKE